MVVVVVTVEEEVVVGMRRWRWGWGWGVGGRHLEGLDLLVEAHHAQAARAKPLPRLDPARALG